MKKQRCEEPEKQVLNRQVSNRRWFTLYKKMAAVQQIQQNIYVSNLSMRAACKVANIHHEQIITWKRDIISMQEKRNKKARSFCSWQNNNTVTIQ